MTLAEAVIMNGNVHELRQRQPVPWMRAASAHANVVIALQHETIAMPRRVRAAANFKSALCPRAYGLARISAKRAVSSSVSLRSLPRAWSRTLLR